MTAYDVEHARAYVRRRRARGDRKVSVWLTPHGLTALEELRKSHPSYDAAVEAALIETATEHLK